MRSGSKTRELPWIPKTGCLKCIAAANFTMTSTFDVVVVGRKWGLKRGRSLVPGKKTTQNNNLVNVIAI